MIIRILSEQPCFRMPGGYQHVTFLQTKTSTFWENVDIHRENGGTILHQNFYHEAFHVMFLARSPKPLRFVAADVVCLLWPVWKVRMGIGMGSPSGKWDVPGSCGRFRDKMYLQSFFVLKQVFIIGRRLEMSINENTMKGRHCESGTLF